MRNTNKGTESRRAREGNGHGVDVLFAFILIKRSSFSPSTSFESSVRGRYHYALPVYEPHGLALSSHSDYGSCRMVIGLARALDRS